MNALHATAAVPVYLFAASVYWPDAAELNEAAALLARSLREVWDDVLSESLTFHLVASDESLAEALPDDTEGLAVFVPMSGGVQPWMLRLAERCEHIALINAYLPGALPFGLTDRLMHRNAHPSCTDFFAHRRMQGVPIHWMRSVEAFGPVWRAWQAVHRLGQARLLQIGETEPWVINSCRSPERIREQLGATVIPVEPTTLYEQVQHVAVEAAEERAISWVEGATDLIGVVDRDVAEACKVVLAMEQLLEEHEADGLAMACFAMIQELDTTSCLALSMLNEAADAIGACEGDLDAALTLFLLKALGADFIWIANPIIYDADYIDLAHCTAPRCACDVALDYKLMRHHESGRGVAPEVTLPGDEAVSLVRIGNDMRDLVVHHGTTEQRPKMHTCHTQVRVHLPSTDRVLETLMGTHLVMTYGDLRPELRYVADFAGLRWL
jgi:hypothetical protein